MNEPKILNAVQHFIDRIPVEDGQFDLAWIEKEWLTFSLQLTMPTTNCSHLVVGNSYFSLSEEKLKINNALTIEIRPGFRLMEI